MKIILIVIKMLLVISIFCGFWQPSFKITRLATHENRIPVLIDVSSSMQLFNTDSAFTFLNFFYENYSKKYSDQEAQFIFFTFGDSLRLIQKPETLTTKDKNSFFPRFIGNNLLRKSNKIILLSDGNWSNTISPRHAVYNKQCYYVPLKQIVNPAYLHIETESRQQSVVSDTLVVITANISGYKPQNNAVDITCRSRQKIIAKKRIPVDSGFFNETIKLPIRGKKVGITLYELTAELETDSIKSTCYILYTITPSRLSTYLYSSRPSLDRRFITLALQRNGEWDILDRPDQTNKKRITDLLIIFDWDAQSRQLYERYRSSSVAFIGCLPCDKNIFNKTPVFNPTLSPDFRYTLNNWTGEDFPPPKGFITCPKTPYRVQKVYMTHASSPSKTSTGGESPLLFEARYKNRSSLHLPVKGIWRWDFLPHSLDKSKDYQFFSDILLDRMQKVIDYNRNNEFYAYPKFSPIYENDSLAFRLAFPASLQDATKLDISFTLATLDGNTVYRTNYSSTLFQSYTHVLKAPPMKPGTYTYTCTMTTAGSRKTYGDSITVLTSNAEIRMLGQNTLVLNELGKPLTTFDTSISNPLLNDNKIAPDKSIKTVTRSIQLNRSWFLLIVIFVLFSAEWFLRRVWRFD